MKTKKSIAAIAVIFTICLALPSVSYAATGRFSGHTTLYTITTQAEADALPAIIDATGFELAVLVDGDNIVLSGLTISGVSGAQDNINIAVDGRVNVEVVDCTLTGAFSSIYFYGSSGRVVNCDVSGYVKNGITANMPSSDGKSVQIKSNTVIGSGPVGPGSWAQNGIQIGYGAVGVVLDNTVNGNWYTGEDWGASGILIFESSDCLVQGNTVIRNEFGIVVETWAWYVAEANNNKIVKNTISDGYIGISINAYAWVYSAGNPEIINNKVTNNDISNQDYGVDLGAYDLDTGDSYVPVADNNKIVRNKFSDIGIAEIYQSGDIATKVKANII